MRLLELFMLLMILPFLLWPLLPWPRPRWLEFLPGAAVLLLIIQLFVEGYRWQMTPAYLLVIVLFLLTLPRLRSASRAEKKRTGWKAAGAVLGLILWLLVLALPVAMPVPKLPQVTGPYAIGTRTYHLVDQSREEIYTDDAHDKREIMIQLWYPADPDVPGVSAVYIEELQIIGAVLAQRLGLPSFLLDHIDLVDLDTVKNAPLLTADAPYPTLLFSHGLRGIRGQNTAMVRELVSHGFVVATIDHTYGNLITIFPDGLADGDSVLGAIFNRHAPVFGAFVLVAAFAGGMSTVDSQMLTAGSILSEDLRPLFPRKANGGSDFRFARLATLGLLLGIYAWSLLLEWRSVLSLIMLGIGVNVIFVPSVLGMFYWKRSSAVAAFWSLFFGLLVLLLKEFSPWGGLFPTPLGAASWAFLVSLVVFVVLALLTSGKGLDSKREEFRALLN